jgi:hypothetical protein
VNDRQEKELMAEDIPTPSPSVRVFLYGYFYVLYKEASQKAILF